MVKLINIRISREQWFPCQHLYQQTTNCPNIYSSEIDVSLSNIQNSNLMGCKPVSPEFKLFRYEKLWKLQLMTVHKSKYRSMIFFINHVIILFIIFIVYIHYIHNIYSLYLFIKLFHLHDLFIVLIYHIYLSHYFINNIYLS